MQRLHVLVTRQQQERWQNNSNFLHEFVVSHSSTYFDVHDLGDFPQVDQEANENADLHHEVGLIVQDVQQHNQGLEDSKNDGANRQAFQRLSAVPELDVWWRRRGNVLSSWDSRAVCRAWKCGKLTIFKGEEFKDAVHDGDHNGEAQQVRVGF